MGETNEPSQGMLELIRVLLSRSMDGEQAKSLPDDEIAWIEPLVVHELFQLKERDTDVIIFRYGLYGREPLSFEKVGIKVGKEKPLSRARVSQITKHTIRALSRAIIFMNPDEHNLYMLLTGEKETTPVLNRPSRGMPTAGDLEFIINHLKTIQFKFNVRRFILEKREQLHK